MAYTRRDPLQQKHPRCSALRIHWSKPHIVHHYGKWWFQPVGAVQPERDEDAKQFCAYKNGLPHEYWRA